MLGSLLGWDTGRGGATVQRVARGPAGADTRHLGDPLAPRLVATDVGERIAQTARPRGWILAPARSDRSHTGPAQPGPERTGGVGCQPRQRLLGGAGGHGVSPGPPAR